jgi:hypothetical protein
MLEFLSKWNSWEQTYQNITDKFFNW